MRTRYNNERTAATLSSRTSASSWYVSPPISQRRRACRSWSSSPARRLNCGEHGLESGARHARSRSRGGTLQHPTTRGGRRLRSSRDALPSKSVAARLSDGGPVTPCINARGREKSQPRKPKLTRFGRIGPNGPEDSAISTTESIASNSAPRHARGVTTLSARSSSGLAASGSSCRRSGVSIRASSAPTSNPSSAAARFSSISRARTCWTDDGWC